MKVFIVRREGPKNTRRVDWSPQLSKQRQVLSGEFENEQEEKETKTTMKMIYVSYWVNPPRFIPS